MLKVFIRPGPLPPVNPLRVNGKRRKEDAKIAGITPDMFNLR